MIRFAKEATPTKLSLIISEFLRTSRSSEMSFDGQYKLSKGYTCDLQILHWAEVVLNKHGTTDVKEAIRKASYAQQNKYTTAETQLYSKDHIIHAADNKWNTALTGLGVRHEVLSKSQISSLRQQFNQLVVDTFYLAENSERNGWEVDPAAVLKMIILDAKIQKIRIPFHRVPIRIDIDGSAKDGIIDVAIAPLLPELFDTQVLHNLFHLLLFKGKETYENVEQSTKNIAAKLKKLAQESIVVDGEAYFFDFIACMDLKMLRILFEMDRSCPYCFKEVIQTIGSISNSSTNHPIYFQRNQQEKCPKNNFGVSCIIICLLHLKQRVSENLICNLLRKNTMNIIVKFFHEDLRATDWNFERDTELGSHQANYRAKMIKGPIVDLLMTKYEILLEKIGADMQEKALWKCWKELLQLLEVPNQKRLKIDVAKIKTKGEEFVALWRDRYGTTKYYSDYCHIITDHLSDLIEEYGSLSVYSTQCFERAHSDIHFLWESQTNHGGGRQTEDSCNQMNKDIKQVMQCHYRAILLRHHFREKIIETCDEVEKKFYQTLLGEVLTEKERQRKSMLDPIFESSIFRKEVDLEGCSRNYICTVTIPLYYTHELPLASLQVDETTTFNWLEQIHGVTDSLMDN